MEKLTVQIKYSKHSLERMSERNITEEQVIKALTPPTKIKSGKVVSNLYQQKTGYG